MSKELTPLEALEKLSKLANTSDIRFQYGLNTFTRQAKVDELKSIIETALVDNECYKKQIANLEDLCEKHYDEMERDSEKLKALEIIKENLKYGYVFIGYDKDNKPLFQFADAKLYEEIKKNMTY